MWIRNAWQARGVAVMCNLVYLARPFLLPSNVTPYVQAALSENLYGFCWVTGYSRKSFDSVDYLWSRSGNHWQESSNIYSNIQDLFEKWAEVFCYTNSASNLVISSGLMVRGPLQVVAVSYFTDDRNMSNCRCICVACTDTDTHS